MSRLKNNIEFLGLSYKKELIKICLIDLGIIGIVVLSYFFFDQPFVYIVAAVIGLFLNYFLFSSYSSKKSRLLRKREDEFVAIISYFKIFISNKNNVYHSFECLKPYASTWMSNEIQNLLDDIDLDKSVKPFVKFASSFKSPVIENVMISIYQMVDEGENESRLNQFAFTFEAFSKEHKESLIDSKQKSLDTMNMFPLVGAGAMTMILMLSILTVIGDLSNVI